MTDADSTIASHRLATSDEWDSYWLAAPFATFFESRHWANVWQHYRGGRARAEAHFVEFVDGKSAVVPTTVEWRAGRMLRLTRMSPADTYGGWLSSASLDEEQISALYTLIKRELVNVRWVVNPFLTGATAPRGLPAPALHTLSLDLAGGFDACRSRWSKGHKSAATKALREGVTVEIAEDAEDWRAYFGVYGDSLRRWGKRTTSQYTWPLFEALSATDSRYVRLWLARWKDVVIAGALCLYHPRQVAYWHGAALERHFARRPTNLLIQEAIRDAVDRGATWFDLGPSGGHEGVEKFKRGFAPAVLPISMIDEAGVLLRSARAVNRLARASLGCLA